MLKPDSTRFPVVGPPRISSGPEWTEPEPPASEEVSEILEFPIREDLPADVALDLRLQEILQEARLATDASGVVIALASDQRMVCRATLGDKAPRVGVSLNTRTGLSGACVQTREMQLCDDAIVDPRVNVVACRDLGIRSIVVLPVVDGANLWGLIEVFSSVPRAFGESDLLALQSLSNKVSQTVQEAIEGGATVRAPESFLESPVESQSPLPTAKPEVLPAKAKVHKDYRTGALTAAVLALAVLLGWMVGRVGWSLAVNRVPAQIPMPADEGRTPGQSPAPPPAPAGAHEDAAPAKPAAPKAAAPQPKTETTEPTGGLVVYEHGKVVFRMAPSKGSRAKGAQQTAPPETIRKAATREEDDKSEASQSGYLLERFEPEYPESAKQQHIEGQVLLSALVGADGSVRELGVISGNPELVKAATDAVRKWRFRPHQVEGKPVEFETQITVNFALPENQ